MSELTMKHIAENYGIAFFTFYLVIPFYSKQVTNIPLVILVMVTSLSFYFVVTFKIYQRFSTRRHFIMDSACMMTGILILYILEVFVFGVSTGYQLMTYMILSVSYLPMAFRFEAMKKMNH